MRRCVELLVASLVMAVIPVISVFPQNQSSPAGRGWLKFNGKNSFALAEDDGSFNLVGGNFTIEAWIYPKNTLKATDEWVIIAKPGSFELLLVGGGHRFIAERGSKFAIFFHIGIITMIVESHRLGGQIFNEWHHIAVTKGIDKRLGQQEVVKIYFDGQALSLGFPLRISNSTNPVYIGGILGKSNSFFNGAMDEVHISSKMLEPDLSRVEGDEDTIALWHFDRPQRLADSSGNGHTLIAEGTRFGSSGRAVDLADKLATTWADIKLQ